MVVLNGTRPLLPNQLNRAFVINLLVGNLIASIAAHPFCKSTIKIYFFFSMRNDFRN